MSHGIQSLLFNWPKPRETVAFANPVQAVAIPRLVFTLGTWMSRRTRHGKAAALGSAWRVLSRSRVKLRDGNHVRMIQRK